MESTDRNRRSPARLAAAAVAAACAAVLATASCTPARSVAGEPAADTPTAAATTAGSGAISWPSCRALAGAVFGWVPAVPAVHLPAASRPVSATICRTADRVAPDGSRTLFGQEVIDSDPGRVDRLTAALRRPDDPRPADLACPAVAYADPFLVMTSADGSWVHAAGPRQACGAPQAEVAAAIEALRPRSVALWPIQQLQAPGAVRIACRRASTNLVHVATDRSTGPVAPPGALGADPFDDAQRVRVCRFRVPAAEVGRVGATGSFTGGGMLSAAEQARAGALLADAAAAEPCRLGAARFAVLSLPEHQDPTVYVELDGCRRVLAKPPGAPRAVVAQAPPALLSMLGGG